ncbi:MAG: hypothetical protein OXI46_11295 [Gemmatimonadota bacterium]|nr:hypothetical protein [Gemmatimonadota bacterium]
MNTKATETESAETCLWTTTGEPVFEPVSERVIRDSIALAFTGTWHELEDGPRHLLATVFPVLAQRTEDEPLAVSIEPAAPAPDAFAALVEAATDVQRTTVRHHWWRPGTHPANGDHYCWIDLGWLTELRVDPIRCRIELVFWDGIRPLLPRILRAAAVTGAIRGNGDGGGVIAEVSCNCTVQYCHDHQG